MPRGNRKLCMLQSFPSCQPKTCHDRISDADWIELQWGIFKTCLLRQISKADSYHIVSSGYNRDKAWHAPKADKAEAEACQDPRQLPFLPGKMSILVAICCIDHLVLSCSFFHCHVLWKRGLLVLLPQSACNLHLALW